MDLTVTPILAALGLVAYHLWRTAEGLRGSMAEGQAVPPGAFDSRRAELLRTKHRLLGDIKEVEFDREAGKLDQDDAAGLQRELRVRVVEIMKEIDTLDDVEGRGEAIEQELAQRLAEPKGSGQEPGAPAAAPPTRGAGLEATALFCSQCGRPVAPDDRFCEGCGGRVA
jgi:hypothetical protein